MKNAPPENIGGTTHISCHYIYNLQANFYQKRPEIIYLNKTPSS